LESFPPLQCYGAAWILRPRSRCERWRTDEESTVLKDFKARLARIGVEYQTPPRP
jgi:hypothetical protein